MMVLIVYITITTDNEQEPIPHSNILLPKYNQSNNNKLYTHRKPKPYNYGETSQMTAGSNISNSTLTATSNTHTNAMINTNTNTITNTQSLSMLVATNTTETIDTLDDTIESIETSGGEKEFEELYIKPPVKNLYEKGNLKQKQKHKNNNNNVINI
eukprot:178278_1